MPERAKEGAGDDERPSVDWMDFERPDGGKMRRMVNLGIQEEESRH